MAVTRAPGRGRQDARRTPLRDRLPSDRYDLVLAVIPLLYLLGVVAHLALGVWLPATLAATSLVGVAFLVDAIYLHPPTVSKEN